MRKKKKNEIGQMLVLLMQIGISMLVPIALMTALAYFIAEKTGIKWISVLLFIVGAAAGMRNVYILVKKYLKKPKEPYEIAREEATSKEESEDKNREDRQEEDNEESK